MRIFLSTISTVVLSLFFVLPASAAGCDPSGVDACVDWTQKEVEASGCRMDSQTFPKVVSDLYLHKGCRITGTTWTDISTGATVTGSKEGGINVDTAGCIGRYTPSSYLSTGGFFRTPKEAMNGSLRNKTISGCEMADPGAVTAPIIAKIESCACAAGSPTPNLDSAGASDEGKPAEERPLAVCSKEKHMIRKGPYECGCEKLYDFLDEKKEECVFYVEKGFHFDDDTRDRFQDAVLGLEGNGHVLVEGSLSNGKKFRVAVLKTADGDVLFTADGRHYYDEPGKAIKPGFWLNIKEGWDDVSKGIGRFFGVGKYTGKGTAGEGGKDKQREGQERLDAANLTLGTLKNDAADPDEQKEKAEEIVERWGNRVKNPATGAYDEQLLEEIKNATGVDVPMIKKVLSKDLEGLGDDVLKKLYAFPVDAVITLSKELKSDSFGDAVHLYISEREGGLRPDDIRKKIAGGELTELDFVTSIKGVGQQYADEALFMAYEEAYQRYLISKQL